MSDFRIRRAGVEDVRAIELCATLSFEKYVPRIGQQPAPMLVDYAACIREHLVFAGEEAGQVVGFLVLRMLDTAVLLDTVALLPACQGRGFGRRFMDFAEDFTVHSGKDEIVLYTNERMTENQHFYEAAGYTEYARKCEDGYERVYYRKRLGAGY